MNKNINEYVEFEYNKCDEKYIDTIIDYFISSYSKVLNFFDLSKLDKKLRIKLWNNAEDFRNKLEELTGYEIPHWSTGMAKNDKEDSCSRIDHLSLCEINKIEYHKYDTINELKKGIVHEFVHICHTQFCNYNYPTQAFITEGVATYLANQYENAQQTVPLSKITSDEFVEYSNYRFLFNKILKEYNNDELKELLSGKCEKK